MSTPVVTSKWAGNFDCTVCRRKRLMAEEFSKSALERYRKTGQGLRCKQCTAKQEQDQRSKATKEAQKTSTDESDEKRTCAGPCQAVLSKDSFNRNQWSKPVGKSRCRNCVEKAIQNEASQQKAAKDEKLEMARKKVADLKSSKSATPQEILAAESELAAMEAQKVTGLAPIRLGGRGRGTRNYGRGRGRGRGNPGRGIGSRSFRK